MLETLITSKTRIRILLKFFLNPETTIHMRALSSEMGESTNAVRLELNRLLEAGMLKTFKQGNKMLFKVNNAHPLYDSVNALIRQHVGVDQIISNVLKGLGNIQKIYLAGDLAKGMSTETIEIVIVGELNQDYLIETINKIEAGIGKKILFRIYSSEESGTIDFDASKFLLVYEP